MSNISSLKPNGAVMRAPRITNGNRDFQATEYLLLIVDDSAYIRRILHLGLRREGYIVETVECGAEAIEWVRQNGLPDLVLMDIVMPDMNGFTVAAALQRMGQVPIIFLSSLTDEEGYMTEIARHADEYLSKPFDLAELSARIRRVLMRARHKVSPISEHRIDDRLCVSFERQIVIVDNTPVALTPIETRLLHILFENRGRVLSSAYLTEHVWHSPHEGSEGALWTHLSRLRTKIELDARRPQYLITVRGRGYFLSSPPR